MSPESRKEAQNEMILTVPDPFSFSENINYLARSQNECMYHIENDSIYKAVPAGGRCLMTEISDAGAAGIRIRLLEQPNGVSRETLEDIGRYVRDWFDLDTDLTPYCDLARRDPLLRQVIDRFWGLRIMGIPDLFEALCWGIIGQQINLPFAYTLKRRFVESFGHSVEWSGRNYWLFPSPHRIAQLTVPELYALQMTTKKAEYLIDTARLLAEGKITKAMLLGDGGLKHAEKRLVAIRGIGPWTANYVLMRCLRIPSAFPLEDVGLHNAIKHLLGLDRKPTLEEVRRLAADWTGWEAYATFYLWRCLY
ncbi:DNA-3-methyladenine glycosylase family protein [Paenibacillus sp. MBLB4367]|uniref:DNA-3-methyladenine glycosylase family protein n=1 Tax=Paenibacillus sp. MBLB4367 TaxID=3384767 RepID=UPI00390842AB